LVHGVAVGVQGWQGIAEAHVQSDALLAEARPGGGDSVLDHFEHVNGRWFQAQFFGVQAGDADQVVDQVRQPVYVGLDALQELALQCAEDAHRFAKQ